MSEVEHVVSAQCCLGEGPIWHPTEQVLYWLDILQGCLHRFDPQTGDHQVTELGMVTSAMGVRASGGFVMSTKKGFAFWDPNKNMFDQICDPDPDLNDEVRFNDGKTDRQGRFWAGKMSAVSENSLFRLDGDGSVHRMESNIQVSNGLGWSPDMGTFYYTDSGNRTIYAYDFDERSGNISGKRIFSHVAQEPGEGIPDGLAIDEQGYLWSARWGGWKIVRYAPDGRVEREVPMPVEFPTSCAFGGPDLKDLYITSAWTEIQAENRASQPLAGDVFRITVPVGGFPEPVYRG